VSIAPSETKLRADVTSELPRRRYHASFDFHFLRFAVELGQQPVDGWNHFWNIVDDDRVGAFIRNHVTALREEFLNRDHHILGMSVAEETRDGNFLHRQRFRFYLGAASVRLFLESIDGSDAQDVAFQFSSQIIVLQHDVERLVPRHIIQHHCQSAVHIGIQHHVQPADFVNQAEEILQIHIFQIHGNRLAGIFRTDRGGLLSGLRLLLGREIDRRCDASARRNALRRLRGVHVRR
jgi:hypothetical protein